MSSGRATLAFISLHPFPASTRSQASDVRQLLYLRFIPRHTTSSSRGFQNRNSNFLFRQTLIPWLPVVSFGLSLSPCFLSLLSTVRSLRSFARRAPPLILPDSKIRGARDPTERSGSLNLPQNSSDAICMHVRVVLTLRSVIGHHGFFIIIPAPLAIRRGRVLLPLSIWT